jgi:hypothetical protein
MRVLIVIELIVGLTFMIVFALADLARDLSQHSYPPPLDLDNEDEWDAVADESIHAVARHLSYRENLAVVEKRLFRWANVKKTLKGKGIDLDSGSFMRPWPIAERHGRLRRMLEWHFAYFGKCQLQRARSRKSLKRVSLFH